MKKRLLALLMVFVLAAACLAGCASDSKTTTGEAGQSPPTTRTVTDMAGRTVTVPAEIKSIGTLGAIGVLNAFVETMGEGDKICNEGSPSFVKNPSWAKYQYEFTPQIKNCPPFQGADSELLMENILAQKPDLCLTMMPEIVDQLEAQGLNVIYLSWNETEDVKKCITLLGEVLNAPDTANDYLAYFDKMVARADEMTKGIKPEDRKTVLYGNVSSFTQPHVIAEWWISKAGGISVTDNGREIKDERYVYTMEDLLKWNPDVMLVSSSTEKDNILADGRLANITAVKNKEIYVVPRVAHVWGNRTTEQPLTIMWAMNKLYPEIMTDEALAQEISYFYSHFFKYDFSSEQIKEIIG